MARRDCCMLLHRHLAFSQPFFARNRNPVLNLGRPLGTAGRSHDGLDCRDGPGSARHRPAKASVSDDVYARIVCARLKELGAANKPYVLDGFPRTAEQAKLFAEMMVRFCRHVYMHRAALTLWHTHVCV